MASWNGSGCCSASMSLFFLLRDGYGRCGPRPARPTGKRGPPGRLSRRTGGAAGPPVAGGRELADDCLAGQGTRPGRGTCSTRHARAETCGSGQERGGVLGCVLVLRWKAMPACRIAVSWAASPLIRLLREANRSRACPATRR